MPGNDDLEADRAPDVNQRRVGLVLNGKWRLDELLGIGGMAAVYGSTHRNGNRVAIKILHPHCTVNDNIRSRFQREGYVANKIEHPGAVRVLDDDRTDDGMVFLVMELLDGETLEARLNREGRLAPGEAVVIIYRLLDVLASAHAKGIVHRDIKLDNVFLTRAGEVKVLDFGIARLAETSETQQHGRTRTGAMLGTPAFMAPEQALARSNEIDAQTDLWAVGATLFKLLTGRYVHEATTMNEQLVQAATRPAPPLLSILPAAPPDLAMVVDRALAFHKSDRWANAKAMQEGILPMLGPTGLAPVPSLPRGLSPAPMFSPMPMHPSHPMNPSSPMNSPVPMHSPVMHSPIPMHSPVAMQSPMPMHPSAMHSSMQSPSVMQSPVGVALPMHPSGPMPSPVLLGQSTGSTTANVASEVPRSSGGRSLPLVLLALVAIVIIGGAIVWSRLRESPPVASTSAPVAASAPLVPVPAEPVKPAPVTAAPPEVAPSAVPATETHKPPAAPAAPVARPTPAKAEKGRPSSKPVTDDDDTFGRRH